MILGFQKSQSFLHVIVRNYQIMYIARDLLKAKICGLREGEGRGGLTPLSRLICEILYSVGQGNFTFSEKSQGISETSGCRNP